MHRIPHCALFIPFNFILFVSNRSHARESQLNRIFFLRSYLLKNFFSPFYFSPSFLSRISTTANIGFEDNYACSSRSFTEKFLVEFVIVDIPPLYPISLNNCFVVNPFFFFSSYVSGKILVATEGSVDN